MAEDRNGGTMESVSIDASLGVDRAAAGSGVEPAPAGLLAQADRRRAAEKLRDKGWSYRRIAENLGVPYILVSKWLSEDPQPAPSRLHPAAVPPPLASAAPGELDAASDTIETLKLQYAALEAYVAPMLEALEASRTGMDANAAELARERDGLRTRVTALETSFARLQLDLEELRTQVALGVAAGTAALAAAVVAEEPDPFADPLDQAAVPPSDPFAEDPFAEDPSADDPFAEPSPVVPIAVAVIQEPDDLGNQVDPFADTAPASPDVETAVMVVTAAPEAAEPDPFAEPEPDPFADPRPEPDPFADEEPEPASTAKTGLGRLRFWKR